MESRIIDRRFFVKSLAASAAFLSLPGAFAEESGEKNLFEISLAEWSLHRSLKKKVLTNMQFPEFAKKTFGITAVEYVNGFFKDKANDKTYLTELKKRCDDNGIRSVLIMCDREGALGDPNEAKRKTAVNNHHKWVDAAKFLGCHSIRVNAQSKGSKEEQMKLAADGLSQLSTYAKTQDINVIVENHGGLSSNGAWLAGVMKAVNMDNCGTLPDFGNFHSYDRYLGVKETMPYAKGVSAKSHGFNAAGEETKTDYKKMLKLVLDAGYRGYIGVEYEGKKHSEIEGIKLTRDLLIKVRDELKSEYK